MLGKERNYSRKGDATNVGDKWRRELRWWPNCAIMVRWWTFKHGERCDRAVATILSISTRDQDDR